MFGVCPDHSNFVLNPRECADHSLQTEKDLTTSERRDTEIEVKALPCHQCLRQLPSNDNTHWAWCDAKKCVHVLSNTDLHDICNQTKVYTRDNNCPVEAISEEHNDRKGATENEEVEVGDDKLQVDVGSEVLAQKKWRDRQVWMVGHVSELNGDSMDVTFADSTIATAVDLSSAHLGGFTTRDHVKLLPEEGATMTDVYARIVKIHADPLS